MPRDITVTFSDGSTHIYRNAPDDITPDQVTQRAQSEFPSLSVTALDGGRGAATKSPAPKTSTPAPKTVTREDEIKRIARERVAQSAAENDKSLLGRAGNVGMAALEGAANAASFGLSPRIQALVGSVKDNVPYEDALTYYRERNRAMRDQSLAGDITGTIAGSLGSGVGVLRGAQTLARSSVPVVQQAGNFLTNALNLRRGETVRNLGRMTGTGALFGAAQAGGEGNNIVEGAAMGGALAGGLGIVGNTAGAVLRQSTRPILGTTGQALREIVSEAPEQLARRQADMSRASGRNVPLVGALRERDNASLRDRVLRVSDDANEAARGYTEDYISSFADRMRQHVVSAGGRAGMARSTTPAELVTLRDQTADQLMAPIERQRLDIVELPTQDLERQLTIRAGGRVQGLGGRIAEAIGDITPAERQILGISPEQNIDEAAQLATRIYAGRGPIDASVRELESVRRLLNAASTGAERAGNGVDAAAFRNASDQLVEFISNTYPDYRRMIDTFAAQSRMLEGFELASKGKRVADLTSTGDINNMRTPEGLLGQRLGEYARHINTVDKGSPAAIRLAREMADRTGNLTRQGSPTAAPGSVTENLGPQAAQGIQDAAGADYRVLQRMMQAGNTDVAKLNDEALVNPATLAYGVASTSPSASPYVKLRAVGILTGFLPTGYSPRVAENIVDMMFSGDPAQTQQALRALERLGIREQFMRSVSAPSGTVGGQSASPASVPPTIDVGSGEIVEEPVAEPQASVDQGFEDLAARVEMAESNSNQNAVSPKGAIGVMQIMPKTGPDAARLAGLEWDAKRFREDEDYNRTLGRAYLQDLMDAFGDPELALVAYNWGRGNLRKVLDAGENWRDKAPQETIDYVQKILG